ncbi:HD domain-containing protein [Methylobacillus sp.]|uniref:HD domain-containing protein n=1 Tax=Methylobacillus sp. TaxID=56818 RepID=UPI0012D181A6|nr:HD domain-containing protein [Methylobacillus sp.]MPS48482.1 HD domain-containing protein [Methylobacillus sp.]
MFEELSHLRMKLLVSDFDDAKMRQTAAFMVAAHEGVGQKRDYTGEPYYTHPIRVASILAQHSGDVTMAQIQAALLHDVVEDTKVKSEVLRAIFGDEVTDMVDWLTNPAYPPGYTREERTEEQKTRMGMAPANAQSVKVADILHNCSDLRQYATPDYVIRYISAKIEVITNMQSADSKLRNLALEFLNLELEKLGAPEA